jgi:hypothetical protein
MGLSPQATRGFTAVLILAIATTISGWLLLPDAWRLAAVWWGVAVLMIGLLVVSLMMPQESW